MATMATAETILEQLGGRRFIAMTGASAIVGGELELRFRIGRGARDGINLVRVQLDASDTYTVEGYRLRNRGLDLELKASEAGVYADQLRAVFTRLTGFDCSL